MSKIGSLGVKAIKKISRQAGYHVTITKYNAHQKEYETVIPGATYAPWLTDHKFNEVYSSIKKYTLVDTYRCYELWQLMAEVSKLRGAVIEIGTWKGGTGALLAKKAADCGIPDTVYLCDTFAGVVKAGSHDSEYAGGEHFDATKEEVETILRVLGPNNAKILVGVFPDETSRLVSDKEFRFCHIDVDVYQSAKDTLDWVWSKLVVGGLVVFDDYGFKACDGVTRLVNEERAKHDRIVIHNLNGHAVLVKIM